MRGNWAKRIPPVWAIGIALGIGGLAAAEPLAGWPDASLPSGSSANTIPPNRQSTRAGSPQCGASNSPETPMLAVPPRRDDQVVRALWAETAAPSKEAPHSFIPPGKLLPPPTQPARLSPTSLGKAQRLEPGKKAGDFNSLFSAAGGLGIVIGIFLVGVWLFRRSTPQSMMRLPGEVFEILGRAPLAGKQQVHLLRCGSKLLLVSVTPTGAETLAEITDPVEVDRLAGFCHQTNPQSSSAAFRRIFEQLAPQRANRGLRDRQVSGDLDVGGWELDRGGSS
jgi:flagellar biogenesis protein FliO